MTFIEFITLSALNLGIIVFILRKRSIASAEGLCMAYLGMAVVTDNVEILVRYFVSPDSLPLGHRELAFRFYPTVVEILGLVVLAGGLWIADGKGTSVCRELDDSGLRRLRSIGVVVTVIGLALTSVALYLVGALSSSRFYSSLNSFRDEALPFGGFWYRGADIAVFGMALTLPSFHKRPKRLLLVLALMMGVSFFLRTNKGGLEEPILWAGIVLFVYNRRLLRSLTNTKTVAAAVVIAFLGVGLKFWLLPEAMNQLQQRASLERVVRIAAAGTSQRWGDDGLYRGYCQFVNTLPDNRWLFRGAKVGVYSLTSWIPRFLYPNKPDHPFRGLGFAIYSDFHAYRDETPAPMIVGSAMADDGFASLIGYLFLAGVFLGLIRRVAFSESRSLFWHCCYLLFALFGGLSADEGTLGTIYTLLLACGVIVAARVLIAAKELIFQEHPQFADPPLQAMSK
jgi:hypothetical protein